MCVYKRSPLGRKPTKKHKYIIGHVRRDQLMILGLSLQAILATNWSCKHGVSSLKQDKGTCRCAALMKSRLDITEHKTLVYSTNYTVMYYVI